MKLFNWVTGVIESEEIEENEEPSRQEKDIIDDLPKLRFATKPYNPTAMGNQKQNIQSEEQVKKSNLKIYTPSSFNEVQHIGKNFKDGCTIIVNFDGMEHHAAWCMFNFICGMSYALDGHSKKISSNVFVFTPKKVEIQSGLPGNIENKIKTPFRTQE